MKPVLERLLAPLHDPILGVTSSDELPFVQRASGEPAPAHTAMLLESVTDVIYIGSNSVGTNGDLTNVLLPGNIMAASSGYAVERYSCAACIRRALLPMSKPGQPCQVCGKKGTKFLRLRFVIWIPLAFD
ncbi:hypothetical protein [Massilia niabensis]|uniref:Deacetylase sirtuin-type domain-containing protein n=1 Tax=Massilia niabensis TaxID=544910 RepID=A0ABW0L723_9BURK